MKFAELGTSGVVASRVALGVMRIHEKSAQEAVDIVNAAVNSGINFFDTADCYTDGESSRVLGRALKDAGIDRNSIYLQTKFGIVAGKRYDFSKQHLIDALNYELENLGVDYVDFVLLHRPDTLVELDGLAEAFNELYNAGKVRHFGVSNVNPWQTELLQSAVEQKLEVNQLQFGLGHTGMIEQEFHVNMRDDSSIDHDGGSIAYTRLKKITIQAWSPCQYGFFEGVFIDNPKFPELNAKLEEIATKYHTTKNAIATAWILRHPARMQVILGSMNPERIAQMAAGADVTLEAQEWYDLYFAAGNDLP